MKHLLTATALLFSSMTFAQDNIIALTDSAGNEVKCNWGKLTSTTIVEDGFDQGGHASGQLTPRAGLANVIERGNMQALCEFIQAALEELE